jgi:predicted nucleotidyltransferase
MKVLGIIVEYNPFHNGHFYHIQKAKEKTLADFVVCVMSGNFVQRGEPAIMNKWSRAEIAVNYGIDLIFELPFVYSMSSAEYFSQGAIKLLDGLGIADYICFGSESGNIETLDKIADILVNNDTKYNLLLKNHLGKGISFPKARQEALNEYLKDIDTIDKTDVITTSNNILGIEYLKALKRLNSPIKPITIKRFNNNYNEKNLTGNVSSATSIRNILSDKNLKTSEKLNLVKDTLPNKSYEILKREIKNCKAPITSNNYNDTLVSMIRKYSKDELKNIPYIIEGLENKFKKNADLYCNLEDIIKFTKSKRYTHSRIQRTIFNILVGINYKDFNNIHKISSPIYGRILAFNDNGKKLLSKIKNNSKIPVSTKFSVFYKSCNKTINKIAYYEKLSTDLFVLAYKNPNLKNSGQDFTNKFIKL